MLEDYESNTWPIVFKLDGYLEKRKKKWKQWKSVVKVNHQFLGSRELVRDNGRDLQGRSPIGQSSGKYINLLTFD